MIGHLYCYRAECSSDSDRLLELLPADELLHFTGTRTRMPDQEVEIELRTFSLDQLRDVIRRVPDGHVMLQTVQPKHLYTGVRSQLV